VAPIYRYLKIPVDIRRCPQILEDACRYGKIPEDISRYPKRTDTIGYLLFPLSLNS